MEDVRQIEDMPIIIEWSIRHQFAFIYEIATEVVRPLLPAGIEPYEARPGISLMFLGYNDYYPGNVIYGEAQPHFKEITRFFLVHPDLSVDMRIPRFTFFVHRIGSNNPTFIRQEIEKLHLPSWLEPSLEVEVNDRKDCGVARDRNGIIQEWRNTNPRAKFYDDAFFGQYYTVQDGKLYFGVWYWSGGICTHQYPGDGGGIHEHPFLTELPARMPASAVGRSYMQMVTTYDKPLVQRFYRPRLVREL